MSILKTIAPRPESTTVPPPRTERSEDSRQRGLMVGSLCLLLLALSIVLYHDRYFWFPDSPDEAESEQPVENSPAANAAAAPARAMTPADRDATVRSRAVDSTIGHSKVGPSTRGATKADDSTTSHSVIAPTTHKLAHARRNLVASGAPAQAANQAVENQDVQADIEGPMIAMTNRTVLPPVEVEVVAGDTHRMIRPGSNALHVELQPGETMQVDSEVAPAPAPAPDTAATVTRDATERVEMSADTAAIVTRPVKPSYPLLARQMKVQGSVILQALIGKDGAIQNLRLVSGPRMLASAAEDAVRQWRFKPHLESGEAVETETKITVNFTISTN